MCNLYRLKKSAAEVADLFRASPSPSNSGGEIYPGYPGMVIESGQVRTMTWGFPLAMKSKKTGKPLKPKPVNNARTDKLDSYFWKASFRERRCLIPVTDFAEAEGARGSMTRTWFSDPSAPLMALAGVWRDSAEWGPVYSMIMTDANPTVAPVHNRMPVILAPEDRQEFLEGTEEEARALCVPYSGELEVDRTGDPWVRRGS